jgi:hypothetical protein
MPINLQPLITLTIAGALTTGSAAFAGSYTIDRVDFPDDIPPEVGGLEFDTQGTLYVALRRGDILTATPTENPDEFKWNHFASGFHNPCGIHVVKPGHIVIGQMAELTEVIDTDKDGTADEYRNICSDFGLSGNYHETMDICSDGDGGYYIAPGTASHNGPTMATPRGPYSTSGRYGRNYSAVKYRGWVLHVSKTGEVTPVSSGYRMHNGIERAPDGTLWCGDNQGDWRAASPIYNITPDSFMGHPSSLVWDPRFDGITNPLYMPRLLLDDLWNKPAFHIPHKMVHSCAEPAFIPADGSFGPFAGQMLVPDQSGPTIVRCIPEMIDGAYQGAATYFYTGNGLSRGNNRLAFSPDGKTLYVGQTGRGWGALSEGLQRIRYTGALPFDIQNCSLTENGFTLTFTMPVTPDSITTNNISITRYRYEYSYRYGGPLRDQEVIPCTVELGQDAKTIQLKPDGLLPNYLYNITANVKAENGETFTAPIIYTLNRLKRPSTGHTVTLSQHQHSIDVAIDGKPFTTYITSGFSKPILYPIHNPSGTQMTRDWPVTEKGRKGEEHDHPHHKSLFIGHQGQNNVDFWHEGPKMGTVEHARVLDFRSGEDRALLRTFNIWKDASGKPVCTDTRELTFGLVNDAYYIDLELNMHASHGDLTFQEFKDGFVGLRTHPHLRLTPKPKAGVEEVFGQAENSLGTTGKAIWGQRADWVHYFGKVEGKPAGFAFMAHNDNPRSPTWWHARDYGLVAANPFGPIKNGAEGEMIIPEGQSLTLRYRFLFHDKPVEQANIKDQYQAYINKALVPRTLISPIPTKK